LSGLAQTDMRTTTFPRIETHPARGDNHHARHDPSMRTMDDPRQDSRSSAATQKLRILIVDDDATFRNRLVAAMTARNFEAYGASNPSEARQMVARVQPHRAVLDMRMPGGSGLDLVLSLIELNPNLEVVMLTGYGSIPTAIEAVRRGAVDYLTKPADADQILASFERVGERAVQPPEGGASLTAPSLARVEWEHIQRVLSDCHGNISQSARVLGIHRRSLQRKLSKYPPAE
jgi:two-component system response regulator RegA